MTILKYFSIILVGFAATVCQAEIAIEVPPPEEPFENPTAPSGATPSENELKVEPLRLAIDLVDGSHIIGVPSITSVPVKTSYAKMDIPLAKMLSIQMDGDRETSSFTLRNGDKLKGVLSITEFEIETIFGKHSIGIDHVQVIDVHHGKFSLPGKRQTTGTRNDIPMGSGWVIDAVNYTFNSDGSCLAKSGEWEVRGTWRAEHEKFAAQWLNGFTDTFDLPGQDDTFTGVNQEGRQLTLQKKAL
jgi:hypothetical protein